MLEVQLKKYIVEKIQSYCPVLTFNKLCFCFRDTLTQVKNMSTGWVEYISGIEAIGFSFYHCMILNQWSVLLLWICKYFLWKSISCELLVRKTIHYLKIWNTIFLSMILICKNFHTLSVPFINPFNRNNTRL